jgi:hypothetical protein
VLVLTSGSHRVDTDWLGVKLGGTLGRASKELVKQATGQVIGGVAPGGASRAAATLVDVALADYPVVWAAAGHAHTVFPTSFDELCASPGERRRLSSLPELLACPEPAEGSKGASTSSASGSLLTVQDVRRVDDVVVVAVLRHIGGRHRAQRHGAQSLRTDVVERPGDEFRPESLPGVCVVDLGVQDDPALPVVAIVDESGRLAVDRELVMMDLGASVMVTSLMVLILRCLPEPCESFESMFE